MNVVTLTVTALQWATIDSQMDNSAYSAREAAAVSGDVSEQDLPRLGELGFDAMPNSIRESGSTQVPWVEPDRTWPPDGQMFEMALADTQWRYVAAEIRNAVPIYESLNDQESLSRMADVLAVIESQVGG